MGTCETHHRVGKFWSSLGRTCGRFPSRRNAICKSLHALSALPLLSYSDFQSGIIEQGAPLLHLNDNKQYNEHILVHAAKHSEENDRIPEAIKLYNLAGDYSTVISCLAQAVGNTISQPSGEGDKNRVIERTASDILKNYERTNRAVGRDRDAVIRLLRIREALDAKSAGRTDVTLEVSSGPTYHLWLAAHPSVHNRSWNLSISFLLMATLPKLQGGQKSSRICTRLFNGICKPICLSPWMHLQPFIKK